MASKKKTKDEIIEIVQEQQVVVLKGTSPLLLQRMTQKALNELFMPSGEMSKSEKKTTLKHDPYREFRDAPYQDPDPEAATLLRIPMQCLKKSIACVAIDVANKSSKAQLTRLLFVSPTDQPGGMWLPIWGIPQMHIAPVRCNNISKTPDVRTRACVPEWVVIAQLSYPLPILNGNLVSKLVTYAGMMQGLGDYRLQKGGHYGAWTMSSLDDPEVQRIMSYGRTEQLAAMENPACFDQESTELLEFFDSESTRRGFRTVG